MSDDRQLAKLRAMSVERLMAVLYGLLKSWEMKWPDHYDDPTRINNILDELNSRDEAKWKRFLGWASKTETVQDLVTLIVFLEREQKLNLKDEDILSSDVITGDKSDQPVEKIPLYFVLDNLRSSFNVGSIFRLAECLGVKKIFLLGYSATPDNSKIKSSAMGAEELVDWVHFSNEQDLLKELREEGIDLVGIETAASAVDYSEFKPNGPLALWVGNERFGIEEELLTCMDHVLKIPLYGRKNSLNVAQALSVIGFHVGNQLHRN